MGLLHFFKKKQNERVEKIMGKDYYATLYMQKVKDRYDSFLQKQIKYDEGDEDLNRAILLFNRVCNIENVKEWFSKEEVIELREYMNDHNMSDFLTVMTMDANFNEEDDLGYFCYHFYNEFEKAISYAKEHYGANINDIQFPDIKRKRKFVLNKLECIAKQEGTKEESIEEYETIDFNDYE